VYQTRPQLRHLRHGDKFDMTSFEPSSADVRPLTTAARIHAVLRNDLVAMRLKPGTALLEKELCQAFGVSRTPVREALLRLAEDRLVDIHPQIGTFVSRIAAPAVRDAMVIRQALERVCVRQAALVADKSDLAALLRLIVKQKEAVAAGAFEEFHAADEALHQTIADIAGHPNIWRVIKREKAQVDRFRLLTLPLPNRAEHVIAEHEAIVDAIAEHDPSAAESAMQAHLEAVLPVFDEVRKSHPDFFESEPQTLSPRRAALA